MTGFNPTYDTIPMSSFQNSQNKCRKSSFTNDRRCHLILPFPPVHTLPTLNARTCSEGAPIDDVTISSCDRLGNLNHQWMQAVIIIMWIIGTPIIHIVQSHNDKQWYCLQWFCHYLSAPNTSWGLNKSHLIKRGPLGKWKMPQSKAILG